MSRLHLGSLSLALVATCLAPPARSEPAPALAPLSAEEVAALAGVRADPPPEELSKGLHFIVSDEKRHYLFQPTVQDLGGVMIGLGTDQNYTLAGWARPELLVLLDFDQMVVDLHKVYRLVFLAAASPEEFLELWSFRKAKELRKLVTTAYPRKAEQKDIFFALNNSRATVAKNFKDVMERYRQVGVPMFLTAPDQYAHLRALFQADRVLMVRGDLTATRTLADLARVLKAQGRVVRALYLSNAEQYFNYTRAFRDNVLGLPYDERSWILRTRPRGFEYIYLAQRPDVLRAWLEDRRTWNVRVLAPRKLLSVQRPFQVLAALPPPPPPPRPKKARAAPPNP
ncbi:MAG TPA: hypothetical protein PK668_22675 [Myxococcota bacterium]|nr:hypothetical protein [Myxococcota bacterium]HRY95499.1 hypothetical protein [Myxococcota bacterium]HSA23384.1 hypothetical protein [Myxococcota bacterium]